MNTETNHHIIELNKRMGKYHAVKREADIIKKTITSYDKILKKDTPYEYVDDNYIVKVKIDYKSQVMKQEQVKIQVLKKIRSLFLYLNRNKKYIFSFSEKRRKFWKTTINTILRLKQQMKEEAESYPENQDIFRSMVLLKSTLNNYTSDYGITIGLVLNHLFCRDISWTIYEYI